MIRVNDLLVGIAVLCLGPLLVVDVAAQITIAEPASLPAAPQPQWNSTYGRGMRPETQLAIVAAYPGQNHPAANPANTQTMEPAQAPGGSMRLTRGQAEQLALKNNPRISASHLLALAQHQVYRQSRAAELPNFNGAITAVDANEGSRIGAGTLNAPRLLEQ